MPSMPPSPFSRRPKILLVGLGAVGQRHARNLRTLLCDEVELWTYRVRSTAPVLDAKLDVDRRPATPSMVYGVAKKFSTLDAALDARPDAVIVANPTSLHLETARRAVEAGVATFIEKPLAHTLDGVDEFLQLVEARRVATFCGLQWRFHPLLQLVRQHLANGVVGQVTAVRAESGEYLPGWHKYEDYRTSYASRSELGGGVLLTQIHDFDYLGWLFGWPERVFCVGGKLSDLELDVEDTGSTLMACRSGQRVIPVHLHQDYLQRPAVRSCDIVGDAGKIHLDLRQAALRRWDASGELVESLSLQDFDRNALFLAEMRNFLDCIAGRAESIITAREGALSLRVALAAKDSIATGQIVKPRYC
jgi:predicted dehydrogenase